MAGRWTVVFALLLPWALALPVRAQSDTTRTIRGRIVDDSTGAPLARAHVFVAGSTIGTVADSTGRFRLANLPSGATRLVATRVGYTPNPTELVLSSDTTITLTIRLSPSVVEVGEVTVAAERDEEWHERRQHFERLFVGPSAAAAQCHLRNPEVLRFDTAWWGRFEASASRPLVVENRALGYRVTYHLDEFEERGDVVRWDGEPHFEPLVPEDAADARRWAANRKRAFRGSLRHFLLALLHDVVEEEQFRLYRHPRARTARTFDRSDRVPVDPDRLLKRRPDTLHEFDVRGALEVVYRGAPEDSAYVEWADHRRSPRDVQVSYIRLNEHPIHVDDHGDIAEPYGATLYGYFAFRQRLAHMLPREYRPPNGPFSPGSP